MARSASLTRFARSQSSLMSIEGGIFCAMGEQYHDMTQSQAEDARRTGGTEQMSRTIQDIAREIAQHIAKASAEKMTGQVRIEVNLSQGGIKDVFLDRRERLQAS